MGLKPGGTVTKGNGKKSLSPDGAWHEPKRISIIPGDDPGKNPAG
jgi:hypothetical protein